MRYTLDEAIELYDSVGLESRNIGALARWIHDTSQIFRFPNVDKDYQGGELPETKTKLTIFGVLVDDLADNHNLRDKEKLETAIRIPSNTNKEYNSEYLAAASKIWEDITDSVEKYPRYGEFTELFQFDLEQFFDSIRYGYLMNTLDIHNQLEYKTYSPHNMMSLLFFDMDLMCHSDFKEKELRKLRPVLYRAQNIVHIGNAINTYPREVIERDYSSPIILSGLQKSLVTREDIRNNPDEAIEELEPLVEEFKERAEKNFDKIERSKNEIESIDMEGFSNRVRDSYEGFLDRGKYWKHSEN